MTLTVPSVRLLDHKCREELKYFHQTGFRIEIEYDYNANAPEKA